MRISFGLGSQYMQLAKPLEATERGRRSALVDHFGRVRREKPELRITRSGLVDHFGRV